MAHTIVYAFDVPYTSIANLTSPRKASLMITYGFVWMDGFTQTKRIMHTQQGIHVYVHL